MDRLENLEVFVRVVEEGGFAPAGRALHRSPAMIAKHVAKLEALAGARLLHRTTRAITLTDAGSRLYEQARSIVQQFGTAIEDVRSLQSQPAGALRVTVPAALTEWLGPAIAGFCRLHPKLNLELFCADDVYDLATRRIDVAGRAGRLPDSSLKVRKLWPFPSVVCASPAYLQCHGTPRTFSELSGHDCIAYAYSWAGDAWHFDPPRGAAEMVFRLQRVRHRVDNAFMVREMALNGQGVIRLPRVFLEQELADGSLVQLLPDLIKKDPWVQAVYLSAGPVSSAVRAFIDHLIEQVDWPRPATAAANPASA